MYLNLFYKMNLYKSTNVLLNFYQISAGNVYESIILIVVALEWL